MLTPLSRSSDAPSPPRRSPFQEGQLAIGRYAVRKRLGSGSMGTVYLAEDQRSGRPVALKVIRADRLSAKAVARLQREFKAIASLEHGRIARAGDFGYTEPGKLPYYTREYIPGTPLSPGPPGGESPREFLQPLLDLLDALDCLRAHGILHLDVHPGNLIVASDPKRGSVLIDFGLAPSPGGAAVTASGSGRADLPPELL